MAVLPVAEMNMFVQNWVDVDDAVEVVAGAPPATGAPPAAAADVVVVNDDAPHNDAGAPPVVPLRKKPAFKTQSRRRSVLLGASPKTNGNRGLRAEDLAKGHRGVVSKKVQAKSRARHPGSGLQKWTAAVKQARGILGLTGFVPCGGASPQGKQLLDTVRAIRRVQG